MQAGDEKAALVARFRRRAPEIEREVLARAQSDPTSALESDLDLQAIVRERTYFVLTSIERGGQWSPPPPSAALAQVRQAPREGVGLDVVLHRIAIADSLLSDVLREGGYSTLVGGLREALHGSDLGAERLMALLAAEYVREADHVRRSPSARREHRIYRLLEDEAPQPGEDLGYDFGGWHLGLVVGGPDSAAAAEELAGKVGSQAIVLAHGPRVAWAWLGGGSPLTVDRIEGPLRRRKENLRVGFGEPRRGFSGWRLTHREAVAAFQVSSATQKRVVRARDVALLAAVLRDRELSRSLLETFVTPLGSRDSALRTTVQAYLRSALNTAAAAALIGVDRHTVQRRLRRVEEILGRPLPTYQAELKVALEVAEVMSASA